MITSVGLRQPFFATQFRSAGAPAGGDSVEIRGGTIEPSPQVYAHRGARGLLPENTIPAYKLALSLGAHFLDADIVMTRDREVVVGHDLILSPAICKGPDGKFVEPGRYVVGDMTLAELQKFDVGSLNPDTAYAHVFPDQQPVPGSKMPTLREVIRYARSVAGDGIGFVVEIKNDPARPELSSSPQELAEGVAKVLADEGVAERTEVQSFDWRCLEALQKINPAIPTQYLTEVASYSQMTNPDPKIAGAWTGGHLLKDHGNSIPRMIHHLGGRVWGAQDTEVTPEQIREAHELGLKVVVWSWPDDPNQPTPADGRTDGIERSLDMGVDGLIHDRPDVVLDVFRRRGLKLPAKHETGQD